MLSIIKCRNRDIFSLINEIKTPNRNCLEPEMVNGELYRVKLKFLNSDTRCNNFSIMDDFLQYFSLNLYKKKHLPEEFEYMMAHETYADSDSS